MKKRVVVILIFALCIGSVFPYMPSAIAAVEGTDERITMTELYNNRYSLTVKPGMTVTIESAEELAIWAMYSRDKQIKDSGLSGVTVELLRDIRYSPFTFSYDEPSGRIGFWLYGELKGTYDVYDGQYYPDFLSEDKEDLKKDDGYSYPERCYPRYCLGFLWKPVSRFAGTFDGNGHCIAGLWQESIADYLSSGILFDELDGCVKNLKLSQCFSGECDIVGSRVSYCDGAICSELRGTIENCHTSDVYIAEWNTDRIDGMVGGLAGEIQDKGTIADSSAETYIFVEKTSGYPYYLGGLAGRICTARDIEIKGNYASGLIDCSDEYCTSGGMIGWIEAPNSEYMGVHGKIENCVSEVDIKGNTAVFTENTFGGIVGGASGEWSILNCENRGAISAGEYSGGIVGEANSVFINQCRNTGNITGSGNVGGIIGDVAYAEIVNTENTGDVSWEIKRGYTTDDKNAGGLIGSVANFCALYNSFCGGDIIAGNNVSAGGVVGKFLFQSPGIMIMDNVCVYGTVSSGKEDNIICGSNTPHDKMGDIYYPGQDLASQCDALNEWVRTKGEVEYSYVYTEERGTFACKEWVRGGDVPMLQLDDSLKPKKPEPVILPEMSPTPEISPTPTVTPKPTPAPILTPTPSTTQTPAVTPIPTRRPIPNVPTESPVPLIVPGVTGVKIKAKRNASLTVQWKQVAGVSGYSVYRSGKKNSGYREISGVPSQKKKWCDKSVKEKKTYYYRVAAYRMIQGKKIYGVYSAPKKITLKLRAPTISIKKKKSGSGQRYIQIKVKKYRASQVELWVKKGKKSFRRVKLHGVAKKKKTNTINLQYKPEGRKLYIRARIYQKKKNKQYKSYYSKTKRIRI